ncbi:MAG TPA: septum formation family protein [Pseudonocardiaceae bacterium]|nr:septum formation family protein [Pseudonocardiaceae bacterium]
MPRHGSSVPPDQRRSSRSIRLIAAGAVLGALTALATVTVPARPGALLTVVAPDPVTEISVQPLRAPVHTCLTWQKPDASDASQVLCTQPHLFEVTGTLDLDDFDTQAAFPDPQHWQQLVTERCTQRTTAALADRFDPFGRFTVGAIKPSEAGWLRGDRMLRCGVQTAGRTGTLFPSTGSVLQQDQSDVHPAGVCLGNDGKAVGDPVDCADPHAVELVGVVDLKGAFPDGYPDEAAQDRVLNTECIRLAKDFAGGPAVAANKGLTLFWETLQAESWQAGSTRVDCRLGAFLPDRSGFAPVTGSVKGPVQVGKQPAPPAPRTTGPAPMAEPPVAPIDVAEPPP